MDAENSPIPPLPRLIDALVTGFEVVAGHVSLILFPVALDVWLWLGPHLSLRRLVALLMAQMPPLTGEEPASVREMMQAGAELWQEVGMRFNLFFALRTIPVGIPSLMAGQQPTTTPWGAPLWVEVHPALVGVVLIAATLVGWLLGAVYFGLIAHRVSGQPIVLADLPRWGLHTLALGMIWLTVLVILAAPLFLCISVLALINPSIASFVLLLFMGVMLWLLFPMFFSPHGIFLLRRSAWRSLLDGLRLARMLAGRVAGFVLAVFVLYVGLNQLWTAPTGDSWWTLVGILGHGYIATSLVAASFVYYRQAVAWIEAVLSRLHEQTRTGSYPTP